jgi:hypothetical protein
LVLVVQCSETEAMPMCGVPGRAENGTQISLYSAELYNPGQKTEYRYIYIILVYGQNRLFSIRFYLLTYVFFILKFKCHCSCQPGLALHGGNSIRTCQNDGSWSGSRPRCGEFPFSESRFTFSFHIQSSYNVRYMKTFVIMPSS